MQAEIQMPTLSMRDDPDILMFCRFIHVLVCKQGLHSSSLLVSTRLPVRAAVPRQQHVCVRPACKAQARPKVEKRHQEREEQSKNAVLERSGYMNTVWANQKHSPSPHPQMLLITLRSHAN